MNKSDSYPVAFRRRKRADAEDFWEGDEGRAKGSGKNELVFPTILCVPLKATGYESVNKCKNIGRQEIKFHREHGLDAGTQE